MYSQAENEMFGQLDRVRHPVEVGLGLLLGIAVLMATLIAPAAPAVAVLVPLMSAGVGIALVVVFADLQSWEHLPRSLQL